MAEVAALFGVGVGEDDVADDGVHLNDGGDELAESAARRAEGVKLRGREAVFRVGTLEVGKFSEKRVDDARVDWIVDARNDFDVALVVAALPGARRRDHEVATDELAPVHVIAKGCREQAQAIASFAIDFVGLLEDGDAGPFEVAGIDERLCLSWRTLSQSSRRPTMMVQMGPHR